MEPLGRFYIALRFLSTQNFLRGKKPLPGHAGRATIQFDVVVPDAR